MGKHYMKIFLGIALSALFIVLSFRNLDFAQFREAFARADYLFLLPYLAILFLNLIVRTVRWKILLDPVKQVPGRGLFRSLLIGYAANNILPAHLGEFLRAYSAGKKNGISKTSVFTSIVIERIIDMISLLIVLSVTMLVFPFPEWVKKSGVVIVIFTLLIIACIVLLKYRQGFVTAIIEFFLRPFPRKIHDTLAVMVDSFVHGLRPLRSPGDYAAVVLLSAVLWGLYGLLFYVNFFTFNLVESHGLDFMAALVLLVITTFSVIIPSSPGYIGTFHWLCQVSLSLFGVPRETGLSYGVLFHAMNYLPILALGLIFAWREGVHFRQQSGEEMRREE